MSSKKHNIDCDDAIDKTVKKSKMSEPTLEEVIRSNDIFKLYFDGGSRGNGSSTSVAAGGFSIHLNDDPKWQGGDYLGSATNNEAEYTGLKSGLDYAIKKGIKKISCHGDSLLVINQMNKEWQVKSDRLKSLHNECMSLSRSFDHITFKHIPRNQNSIADSVANKIMDLKQGFIKNC